MQAFTWDPSFETRLAEVDAQHRGLAELINGLGRAVTAGEDVSELELARLHDALAAYAARHFADEERLMSAEGVDERHRAAHEREHQDFREFVAVAGHTDGRTGAERTRPLLGYLVHWLTYHILGADQSMARQIHAIRAGVPATAAFDAERDGHSGAAGLLLRSVSELFELLSARNRELIALAQTLEGRVAERTDALSRVNRELRELVSRVEHMAMTDALTGLPNRRYAMARLGGAWATAVRHDRGLACLVIDADGFKEVNDTCGHDAGDVVLARLAQTLRSAVREGDEVCRVGGDEFLVLCPETDLDGARVLGERVRAKVAALRVEVPGGVWKGSVSLGAAAYQPSMSSAEELLRAADAGVLEAKRGGRNRVAVAAAARSA